MPINKKLPMYIAVQLEDGDAIGCRRRAWLPLPATQAQFSKTLDRIQLERGDIIIADYAKKVPGLSHHSLMATPLAVVNHLADRLTKLNCEQILTLCAVCDTGYYFDTVERLIDYTYTTDSYTLLPGVTDEEALGQYYIGKSGMVVANAKLKTCIDRREFGKKLAAMEDGLFTPHGYLTSKIGWNPTPNIERAVPEALNLTGCLGEDLYGNWEDESIV